jgi:hypothetical protein
MIMYVGLVHYPIKNKLGDLVATSVTNLDIHDISRSCRTFGIKNYFLITPLKMQLELVNSILGHWEQDTANAYNPDRQDALSIARAVESFELAVEQITKIEGVRPFVIATGANFDSSDGDVSQLTKKIDLGNMPCFLLFGTGWGLHPDILKHVDFKLSPICSKNSDGYNHLSVRSAVAIYLDRFFGNRE